MNKPMVEWTIFTEYTEQTGDLMANAFADSGATLLYGTGLWKGETELSLVVKVIDAPEETIERAVNALLNSGQKAVFVTKAQVAGQLWEREEN